MVVGQTPMMLASALSPPLHFSMCSLPTSAFITSGATMNSPTMSCSTPPLTVQCTQPSSPLTPPNSNGSSPVLPPVTCNVIPSSNAVLTYGSNLYAGMSIMPLNPAVTVSCKVPEVQSLSPPIGTIVPCNPCTQPMPSSAIVPCQPRMVNGSVLPCTPGFCPCPYSVPAEMCSVTSNALIPPSMSIAQTICSTNVVSPWKQSYGMEHVWRKEFQTLFYSYTRHSQHIWTLLPVTERPGGVWYENVDSAKVRFCCEVCGHGWTSMKGRVAFWFILNYTTNEGVCCLKLYGQQCDRCKRDNYEPAMWYPEEVLKVIVNIYNKVGQVYYGFQQAPYHKTRRPGKPRTPHNSDLCQACKDGVCAERR